MAEASPEGKFGRVVLGEDLKPKEAPSVELLPERLRVLPSDLVTKDHDDPDRAHILDPDHIIEALEEDYNDRHNGGKPEDDPRLTASRQVTRESPQLAVDLVRLRVMSATARQNLAWMQQGLPTDEGAFWLYFNDATNFDDNYERRALPVLEKLPKHMRGLDLVIDIMSPALLNRICANLEKHGLAPSRLIRVQRQLILPDSQLINAVIKGEVIC